MSNVKNSLFKFESIDLEKGQAEVRFINKYGPIYTCEKTLDDFKRTVEYHQGSFDLDGNPLMETREEIFNTNPNEDIIYSYDIPLNEDGSLLSAEQLIDYIARQYPDSVFEDMHRRRIGTKDEELTSLVGQQFNVELIYPDPVPTTTPITIEEIVEDI